MFSCEFCEISKSTFFTEHLWTTAPSCSHNSLWLNVHCPTAALLSLVVQLLYFKHLHFLVNIKLYLLISLFSQSRAFFLRVFFLHFMGPFISFLCQLSQPIKHQPRKMVKHAQTVIWQQPTHCFECVWPILLG